MLSEYTVWAECNTMKRKNNGKKGLLFEMSLWAASMKNVGYNMTSVVRWTNESYETDIFSESIHTGPPV